MALVSKRFAFEAAHQLHFHLGKCSYLHGHSYKVEVVVGGPIKNPFGSTNDTGMVVDFDRITEAMKPLITKMDHTFLNDSLPIPVTTAEMIAVWIFEQLIGSSIDVATVRVWETESCYAEVEYDDYCEWRKHCDNHRTN